MFVYIKDKNVNMIKTHGLSQSKDKYYTLWKNIKQRCYNKNYSYFEYWGGRGITMYDKWINDPISFIEYVKSLENYDKDNYSLDRENNSGNYEPGNLRWATNQEQNINQRLKNGKIKSNKTGYKGIFYENGRYRLRLNKIYIGSFDSLDDCVKRREEWLKNN